MSEEQTPAPAKKSVSESEYAPLYAVAGLTDALADALRRVLAESQSKASQRISDLQHKKAPALQKQAKVSAEELRTFVITLPEQFRNLPEATQARIAELQAQANELMAQATATYSDLAVRGKHAVDAALGHAGQLSDEAEQRSEDVPADTGDPADPPLQMVQEGVTEVPTFVDTEILVPEVPEVPEVPAVADREVPTPVVADREVPTPTVPVTDAPTPTVGRETTGS